MTEIKFFKNKYGKELLIDCFRFTDIARASGEPFFKPHSTNFYEVFFMLSGNGEILVDGERIKLQKGTVIFIPPAKPRQWMISAAPDAYALIFEGEFLETFFQDPMFLYRLHYFGNTDTPSYILLPGAELDEFCQLASRIALEIKNLKNDSQHLLRAYLYQVLILLDRAYTEAYKLHDNLYRNTEIHRFRQMLATHIRERQTVKEYAELLGINRNRLNKLCHEAYGKDASEIIRNELLKACKNELLYTDKSVSEIGYLFNFSAISNFTRFFKAGVRLSPAEYRIQHAH